MNNIYLIFFFFVLICSGIMETIRQVVSRHYGEGNDTKKKVILTITGLVVSMLASTLCYFSFFVFEDGIKLSIIFNGLVIYFMQKDVTLEVLKPTLKKLLERA